MPDAHIKARSPGPVDVRPGVVRLERAPSAALIASLEGGLLAALRQPLHVTVAGERVPLDPHFREGDVVALYAGQSVVLTLRLHGDGTLSASAHKAYAAQPAAAALLRRWPRDEAAGFADALGHYLAGVEVGARWVEREGRVQLRWMGRDAGAVGSVPWVPVDREVVLGRATAAARAAAREDEGIAAARDAVGELAKRKGWPAPPMRGDSNEVDQLAIDADGRRVLLVELKPREASGAYYAPLQVLRYFVEWRRAWAADRAGLVASIRAIVEARARVGVGPMAPVLSETAELVPVIAFNDPPTPETLARMFGVIDMLRMLEGDDVLAKLELWAWADGAPPRRLGAGEWPGAKGVRRCNACGSERVAPIVHGFPAPESYERAARGEIVFGGCLVWEGQPEWGCLVCEAEW